jgi:hypothetical protein
MGILSQAMSRNDETGRFDPGTRVTIDKVFNRSAHGKSGTVVRWDEDLNVYVVQIDGWKQEMTFQASEVVKSD